LPDKHRQLSKQEKKMTRRVLILGGTGFVGRQLIEQLQRRGVRMTVATRHLVAARRIINQPQVRIAVGDVTDRHNLTPVAIREGHAFAETLFNNNPTIVDHADIPTAIFTTPEFASVGLTEEAARHAHGDVHIYKAKYRPMKATISHRDEQTLMKLIVDGASNRVLGVHMVGADAGEIIQMAAIAVKMKATKADFDVTIALHPSAAEEFVLMRTRAG